MARTKATPVRREISSEYISKHDRTPRNGAAGGGPPEGKEAVADEVPPMSAVLDKNNGLVQVAIAVGGIYGSLYAPRAAPPPRSRANGRTA